MKFNSVIDRQQASRDICSACRGSKKAARDGRRAHIATRNQANESEATVLDKDPRMSRRDLGLGLGASLGLNLALAKVRWCSQTQSLAIILHVDGLDT